MTIPGVDERSSSRRARDEQIATEPPLPPPQLPPGSVPAPVETHRARFRRRMSKRALLLRLNPAHWPIWESVVLPDRDTQVWFKTGRLRPEDIQADIPVIVLGTSGLGVVASGTTSGGVEYQSDPDWQQAGADFQEEYKRPQNRVPVKIRRKNVSLEKLQDCTATAELHRRRETATWLDPDQYQALCGLMQSKVG
jgi:hypothetical protein